MEKIDRKAALAAGKRRFYTGEPCRAQHDAERYVSSGACVVCTTEAALKTTAALRRACRENSEADRRARAKAILEPGA